MKTRVMKRKEKKENQRTEKAQIKTSAKERESKPRRRRRYCARDDRVMIGEDTFGGYLFKEDYDKILARRLSFKGSLNILKYMVVLGQIVKERPDHSRDRRRSLADTS